jgi:uncharacterized protein YqcC (DUF446 family)
MQESERHQRMLVLLQELETEMRRQQLWAGMPPSAEALSSVMPFMYDTLKAHQWLQWIFIPRTRALMEARGRLPGNCNIHPLAEHELSRIKDIEAGRLLEIILAIDTLMNTPRE